MNFFRLFLLCSSLLICSKALFGQSNRDSVIAAIITEATKNSQLETIAHELLDGIGPRLIGSPKMQQAHDWAVAKYKSWDMPARNEKWGQWRGWERGITHIDMQYPWIKSLEGTQLAWCPSTNGKSVTAEVMIFPDLEDSNAYVKWLPSVKGKFVMISMLQPTGRPGDNWKEFGKQQSIDKINALQDSLARNWRSRFSKAGYTSRTLPLALEKAGAAGVITNNWSKGFGVDKIFSAYTTKIPAVDIALEDYGLIYRLALDGRPARLSILANSRETGMVPTYNTLAQIKSSTRPDSYVMLSAHFDSWDGATGATDNGTGTITMMEAMRVLKKVYPNPKRTIMVGHWGGEEQGLLGSTAFVEDHPKIVDSLQALFNQDNGTGRVTKITGQGLLDAYRFLDRWLYAVPDSFKTALETTYPGEPARGGSDYASFLAAGAPGFSLNSLNWSYGTYTWHTNRDTYDKIIFDDVRNNVILTAILTYMACEDDENVSREKAVLPIDKKTGQPGKWPDKRVPKRTGGVIE